MTLARISASIPSGGLSRRDLLRAALAGAAASLGAPRLLAAPRRGGVFRAGLAAGSTTDSLDPATWSNTFMADFGLGLVGDTLFEMDAGFNAVPNLVESFDHSGDFSLWQLKLKKGVRFHDGRPLRAADVVASLRHHMGEKSKSPMRPVLSVIDEIRADGGHEVVLRLKYGYADLPWLLTDYHLPVLPARADGSLEWEKGIGTGPYRLKEFKPGRLARATRNPDYHGQAWFDAVEMLVIHDVVARTAALTSGDIHYMDRCDLKTLNLLKRNPKVKITDIPSLSHYTAPMDCTAAPFSDVNVRLAMKYAIDRDAIVKKVLFGHGRAGNDNPLARGMKYAIDPKPVHAHDPDRARHHLKRAGLERLSVELSASDAPFIGALDAAQLMRESARAAGIDISIRRVPADGYWSNVWMKAPFCFSQWGGRPTADWMLSVGYAPDAPWNESHWKNERFGQMLKAARVEPDEEKRAALYAEMQQLIHDDGGEIVLAFNNFVSAMSDRIGHGRLNANYDHDGGYMYKRWWFA